MSVPRRSHRTPCKYPGQLVPVVLVVVVALAGSCTMAPWMAQVACTAVQCGDGGGCQTSWPEVEGPGGLRDLYVLISGSTKQAAVPLRIVTVRSLSWPRPVPAGYFHYLHYSHYSHCKGPYPWALAVPGLTQRQSQDVRVETPCIAIQCIHPSNSVDCHDCSAQSHRRPAHHNCPSPPKPTPGFVWDPSKSCRDLTGPRGIRTRPPA